jgi:sec-independent protein translocase protein TatB
VFGISFGEMMLIGVVALMIVGPHRLPKMLGTIGHWISKLRKMTTEVRYQTGIDQLLKDEGLRGGLTELRGLVRPGAIGSTLGALASATTPRATPSSRPAPYKNPLLQTTPANPFENVPHDRSREYPEEGPDAYGCLPDDLWQERTDTDILAPAPLPASTESSTPAPAPPGEPPESVSQHT